MSVHRGSHLYRFLFFLLLLVVICIVFYLYSRQMNWTVPGKSLEEMVAGTADRPFVYRLLVPALVKVLHILLPSPLKVLTLAVMFASLVGFTFAFRSLYAVLWPPSWFMDFLTLVAVGGVFYFWINNKIYDLTNLFLFTLSLALLARGYFWAYFVVFILATLNRETTILLVFSFVLLKYRSPDKGLFLRQLALLLLFYMIIIGVLRHTFRGNPGGEFEIHIENFLASFIGLPQYAILFCLMGVFVLILFFYRFNEKPLFLRATSLAMVPVLSVLYFLIGYPFEIRFFLEIYPLFLLFLVPLLGRMLHLNLSEKLEFK